MKTDKFLFLTALRLKLDMKFFFALVLICFFTIQAKAQTADSLSLSAPPAADSLSVTLDSSLNVSTKKEIKALRFFKKNYPNPRAAALLGVFPGGGQLYNKRWWKVPLVYAGMGVAGYFVIDNGKEYRAARDNYRWLVDGDTLTNPVGKFAEADAAQLKAYRDAYSRYTELSWVAFSLTYLLSITEAFVDAHLTHFDVSEDLTLQIRPISPSANGNAGIGFGVQFDFGGNKTQRNFVRSGKSVPLTGLP